jgi:hypothetical protein
MEIGERGSLPDNPKENAMTIAIGDKASRAERNEIALLIGEYSSQFGEASGGWLGSFHVDLVEKPANVSN